MKWLPRPIGGYALSVLLERRQQAERAGEPRKPRRGAERRPAVGASGQFGKRMGTCCTSCFRYWMKSARLRLCGVMTASDPADKIRTGSPVQWPESQLTANVEPPVAIFRSETAVGAATIDALALRRGELGEAFTH